VKTRRDESVGPYAAKAVLRRTRPLRREAAGVRAAEAEPIHRLRVATRRLATTLALFADQFPRKRARTWRKRLRRLRRALGKARDLDVQAAFLAEFLRQSHEFLGGLAEVEHRPGIERLLASVRRRRSARQRKVVRALDRFESRGVAADLKRAAKLLRSSGRWSPAGGAVLRRRARAAILQRLEDLLALEPALGRPSSAAEHHAMRIAAKRLRYTLEVFRPLYGPAAAAFVAAARQAQSRLGEIHDGDVWVAFLPRFLRQEETRLAARPDGARRAARLRPGLEFLQDERRRARQRLFKDFVAYWQKLRRDRLWERLVELTRAQPAADRRTGRSRRPPEAA
jgi:CHAD domain-containing protein